ncbi:hypothetical protein IWW50_001169 [Coemansia erecta]|nr:hypothetical protein IWW50_001169 [Coemansia erecta]
MPLWCIDEATKGLAGFPRMYEAFEKSTSGAQTAFDTVLRPIEAKWQHSKKNTSSATSLSTTGIRGVCDEAKPYVSLLMVLNTLVVVFPRQMSELLSKKTSVSRLLMVTNNGTVPVDLRTCLVTLVSRWSVVLECCVDARRYLASIVDSFYHRTGGVPRSEFLPALPKGLRLQSGWPYPKMNPDSMLLYTPGGTLKVARGTVVNDNTNNSNDDVAAAPVPNKVAADNANTDIAATRSVPVDSSPPKAAVPAQTGLLELDLESMRVCAQSLQALSSMLKDNLRVMRANENPQGNPVIQDMTNNIDTTYTELLSHSRVLNDVYTQVNNQMQAAADEANRSLAFYNTTIQCHKDWVDKSQTGNSGQANGSKQAEERFPSQAWASDKAESSKHAMAWSVSAPVPEDSAASSTESGEPVISPGLARASTKARGKMADTS